MYSVTELWVRGIDSDGQRDVRLRVLRMHGTAPAVRRQRLIAGVVGDRIGAGDGEIARRQFGVPRHDHAAIEQRAVGQRAGGGECDVYAGAAGTRAALRPQS